MERADQVPLDASLNRQRFLNRFRALLLELSEKLRDDPALLGNPSAPIVLHEGEGYVCSLVCLPAHDYGELTSREREVAALVQAGLPNKSIAVELGTTTGTVAAHLRSIFKKLRITSRSELLAGSHAPGGAGLRRRRDATPRATGGC